MGRWVTCSGVAKGTQLWCFAWLCRVRWQSKDLTFTFPLLCCLDASGVPVRGGGWELKS